MPKSKRIDVCPDCGAPLVWTFLFPSAEWFCMRCKNSWGLFHEVEVEPTPELEIKLKEYQTAFNKLVKHLFVGRVKKAKCKKCSTTLEYHPQHMTPKEKELHHSSWKKLMEKE